MPVSDFSIAVLMGDVQDEELTAMGTRPVKEVNDTNVTAPDKGKEHVSDKNTAATSKQSVVDEKEKELSGTNDATLQRKRTSFSRLQQRMLEAKFQRTPYLTIQERNNLAAFLQLNSRQVKVWFQNRRNKWKRENKGRFLIQPALEMKSCDSFNSGMENCFSCVMYNPFSQLYLTSGNRR